MKNALTRIFSLILACLLVFGMSMAVTATETAETVVAGDVNGDGKCTVFDVLVILRALLYNTAIDGGDVNGDGKFNLMDVVRVLKLASADASPEVGTTEEGKAEITVENGATKDAVSLNGENVSASVPAGVAVEDGATALTLSVTAMADTNGNITTGATENVVSYDVHIDGVSAENTVAIVVDLGVILPVGQNTGTVTLYHVENGVANAMTQVMALTELDAHNEFYYYPATGNVYVALATFSEIALVNDTNNAWEGKYDYNWYDATKSELVIANADQLAAFGAIVGGMAENIERDNFAEKTVTLVADINLGDDEANNNPDVIFHPIGYYYKNGDSTVQSFEGTFDGAGHTIANFYQNTWEIKGDYDGTYYKDAMGLFGYVVNGTVKNLTVDNFSSDGEFTPTGVIAAYAVNSTFENIAITNCNPRVYNTGNGGIIGIAGRENAATEAIVLKNITVDNSNKISALWGSWDVACGGLVGMYRGNADGSGDTISFENCHVAAQIDVYNDVCANYQYYAYRYAGMMIGSIRHNVTREDGKVIPNMTGVSAKGCTVNYGNWNDYYYCEFEKNSMASYSEDYQFSRVDKSEIIFDEQGNAIRCTHTHTPAEDKTAVYLPFHQLFTGYSWGVSSIGLEKYSGIVTNLDITEGDQEESVVKFASIASESYETDTTVTIGELFEAIADAKVEIDVANVQVFVSPADEDSTVVGTYEANAENWTKGTLTFTGVGDATVTIQDYYFCTPTVIAVAVTERQPEEKFEVVMNNGDFLHRVGNSGTVAWGKLFKTKDGVTAGTVSVTVESVNGTGASGTYVNNAIQFSGTGVVKVTVKDDDKYCEPTVLYLEVVDAVNATSATDATENNVVLLNDIGSGFTVSGEHTFYGNGFALNYTGNGQYLNNGLKQGIVTVSDNGTLDNLRINATIYPKAYLYYGLTPLGDYVQGGPSSVEGDRTRYHYQLSAVVAKGNATISNCYIYGGRTNVFVDTGDVTIKDSILECGTVANAQIQSTDEYTVTFENVTTIQHQLNATVGDTSVVMLGAGVLVGPDTTSNPAIVLNGSFKQYNWVTSADKDAVQDEITQAIIQSAVDATAYNHTVNGETASNLGIIYMNEESMKVENKTGLPYVVGTITMKMDGGSVKGKVYSLQNATADQVYSDYVNAARDTVNGDYMPTFVFDLGNQEISYDGSEETRYLYGDANGITALYQDGEAALTLDLSKLATIYKYEGRNYAYDAACLNSNGDKVAITNSVVTLDAQGSYTLEFTVQDNIFYDKVGNIIEKSVERKFTVPLDLTVKAAEIKNADVNISKTALDGVYTTVNLTDYKLRINFLDCINVTDYDNKGNGKTVSLNSNIASATLTPASVNVFTTASTITITYNDGRVLTVNLSKISGSSPGTKTATVNASGYFITDGALDNKPTASSSQNKCTITSVSFKGNNGATVTNDTDVTVTWKLGSSSSGCLAEGTLITLADGSQKPIEEITYTDELLAWDFHTGEYVSTVPSLIESTAKDTFRVINLTFANGNIVKVVVDHGFFDVEENNFVFIDEENVASYVGHEFVALGADGTYVATELVGYEIIEEEVSFYSIQTAVYNNSIANGMFTLPAPPEMLENDGWFDYFEIGEGMQYDEAKMQADIEQYGLYTYDDFAEYVTYEQFIAFNGPYLKVLVGRGVLTFEQIFELIATYVTPNA